jgi:hypothetical protein
VVYFSTQPWEASGTLLSVLPAGIGEHFECYHWDEDAPKPFLQVSLHFRLSKDVGMILAVNTQTESVCLQGTQNSTQSLNQTVATQHQLTLLHLLQRTF